MEDRTYRIYDTDWNLLRTEKCTSAGPFLSQWARESEEPLTVYCHQEGRKRARIVKLAQGFVHSIGYIECKE